MIAAVMGKRTYLGVGAVRTELIKDERIQQVHVTGHLLHAPYLSLLLRVGVFDDQAGGCALEDKWMEVVSGGEWRGVELSWVKGCIECSVIAYL